MKHFILVVHMMNDFHLPSQILIWVIIFQLKHYFKVFYSVDELHHNDPL